MSLASIQSISKLEKHPNADALDIAQVLGYKCIVKRGEYSEGQKIAFIEPDTVLPDKDWAAFYKSKSNRVKAIRLRGEWSMGIVESLDRLGVSAGNDGDDIADILGVIKYEPPAPQDLSAKGNLPFGIIQTNETRWQSFRDIPFGEKVDVTLKIDGQSASFYCVNDNGEWKTGVLGRTMECKLEAENNYTRNEANYRILEKLKSFCQENSVDLCLRGESYGARIQHLALNPHCNKPLGLALFSTYLVKEKRYARKGDPYYVFDLAPNLFLPTVPVLEKDVELTPELIKKYDETLDKLPNGDYFEGVVINGRNFSFKVINKHYDSKK